MAHLYVPVCRRLGPGAVRASSPPSGPSRSGTSSASSSDRPIRRAVDLGCGTGELTAALAERLAHRRHGRHRLVAGDARRGRAHARPAAALRARATSAAWTSGGDHDLVFANASLQWVPDHPAVRRPLVGGAARRAASWPCRCRPTPTTRRTASPPRWRRASRSARRWAARRRPTRSPPTCWRPSSTPSSSTTSAPPASTSGCRSTATCSTARPTSSSGCKGTSLTRFFDAAARRAARAVRRRVPPPPARSDRRHRAVLLPVQADPVLGRQAVSRSRSVVAADHRGLTFSPWHASDGCSRRWSRRSPTTARSTSTARSRWPAGCRSRATRASSSPAPPARRRRSPTPRSSRCGRPSPRPSTIPVVAGSTTATTPPTPCTSPPRRPSSASPACSRCARTTTARRRPASRATCGPSPRPPTCRSSIYDIPVRTGRKISTALLARLAHEVAQHRRRQGRRRQPGRDGAARSPRAPAGFEVYSGDDAMTLPLLAVGAVGLIGVATHWAAPDVVELFDRWDAGDTAGARAVNDRLLESWAFETGDEAPEPGPGQGDAAPPRPAGRPLPPADGRRPAVARRARPPRSTPTWSPPVADARRVGAPWLTRSGSSSSAGSGRSAATAWRSSRAPATTAASCSSTAG